MLHNQRAHFNVQLYLDLQFVDESLALDFETLDETNPNIMHFCKSVQTQVFGEIVTQAASAYNSTIVNFADEIDQEGDGLDGCDIVATSRVYDPEAEDVFGYGYFSLQVHVSQTVVVESSNQTLYLEVVQSVVEKGFDVVSGGQSEFRNNLYESSFFRSVISVRIRRGLTAPQPAPTPRPTPRPTRRPTPRPTTMVPTKSPTMKPSNRPTLPPSRKPTAVPTPRPTPRPSRRPTPRPTKVPSTNPSASPSELPTLLPSAHPSQFPSWFPSISPSTIPSLFPTKHPSEFPTTIPISGVNWNRNPSDNNNNQGLRLSQDNSVLVASILGISVVLATLSCLICFLCYKYQSKSRRYSNFRSPIPLSMNHSHNFVPGIVEVGNDHGSLDDTTLGEHTVGGQRKKRPSIRKGLGNSFDENSLYTSPFPIDEREQVAMAIPPPMPLPSIQSSLSLMTPLEYEETVVFPASESMSDDDKDVTNQEGVEVQFPLPGMTLPVETLATHKHLKRYSAPIDMDSNKPYDEEKDDPPRIMKIEPLEKHPPLSSLHEHDDFSRIPSDLDVWSCDFEDFDRGSDFYKAEEHSTSLSSSASTKRINNTVIPSSSSTSSLLLMTKKESKPQTTVLKPIPPPSVAKPRTQTLKPIPPPSVAKPRKSIPKRIGDRRLTIPPTTALLMQQPRAAEKTISDAKPKKRLHVSSIALRLKSETKTTPIKANLSSDDKTKPRSVSPEEDSQTSAKMSIQSKNSILTNMSTDTKTGATTNTTMDCLGRSGGLLVSSLKDGVTTINDSLISNGNGIVSSLKDGAAPKIDSLSNGIVNSLRDGAPHIEKMGNGLVSSLTDIFDRMAIPKITPEEYGESSVASMTSQSEFTRTTEKAVSKDKFLTKNISDDEDSGISASPWLMEKIENTLGPKSVHADLASLNSHKTPRTPRRNYNGSEVSYGSRNTLGQKSRNRYNHGSEVSFGSRKSYYKNRIRHNGSEVSFGSKNSRYSQFSNNDVTSLMSRASASMSGDMFAEEAPEEISFVKTTRSALEEKKKRLEQQLAELDENESNSINNADKASSVTMSSVTWGSFSTISSRSRTFRDRRQVIVCVPPGKLGVILADLHDGNGTVINSIKSGSPVERILKPGDKLIAVDEIAVVEMSCSQITSLIASRAEKERRFTVMTTVIKKKKNDNEESKNA